MTARIGRWIGALEGFESRMSGVAMTRHYGRLTKIRVSKCRSAPPVLSSA